jgi:DMSO/TMAO reductase YedYZ heme-binding membrane subunit
MWDDETKSLWRPRLSKVKFASIHRLETYFIFLGMCHICMGRCKVAARPTFLFRIIMLLPSLVVNSGLAFMKDLSSHDGLTLPGKEIHRNRVSQSMNIYWHHPVHR